MKRHIGHRVVTILAVCVCATVSIAAWMNPVPVYQSVAAISVAEFGLADSELATANLAALTSGMTAVEKVQFSYQYTHRAANRQGSLVNLYIAGVVGHMGYEITIPAATVTAIKAEINNLADRMVLAQNYVATLTE